MIIGSSNDKSIIEGVTKLAGELAGWLMILISISMVWEFTSRGLFNTATDWVYEYSGYGLAWFTLLSAGYVLQKKRHIYIEIFIDDLTDRTHKLFLLIGLIIILVYSCLTTYFFGRLVYNTYIMHDYFPTIASPPAFVVYSGCFLGVLVLALQTLSSLKACSQGLLKSTSPIQYLPLIIFFVLCIIAITLWGKYPQLALFILLLTTLFGGVPIFASLCVVGTIGLLFSFGYGAGLQQTAIIAFKSTNSNALLAIPLFILSGELLQAGGVGRELYRLGTVTVGSMKGGLGVATVLACTVFAAISGSSVATAATIGVIAIPEMLEKRYEKLKVYGLVAAGGTLGILIPPSAPMILYSGMTNESTGQLFMGGVFPGLVLAGIFSLWTIYRSKPDTRQPKATKSEVITAFREGIWGLLMPILIIGGIYLGIVTATEAGAAALIYALIVSLARRKINFPQLRNVLAEGTQSSCMIMMIIVGAITLGTVVTTLHIPDALINLVHHYEMSKWQVLAVLTVGYIILGMFLEVVSILLITLPIVYPLILSVGINGLWFGVYLVMLMELALITPPVGLNLFVIRDVAKTDTRSIVRGVAPYFLLLTVGLILVIVFPELVLWLPEHSYGR